ncbi:metallophosphoesterase family protein [Petroclostridium sp. X23]|uniref:purple acid phosphatase family protein n=1 Tax=Petroclostridium sp. X23 TaxID=3045146 RepID=UPI0024ADE38F|nr:metallophosphoesterase family protein [Petroclostridium sp. X23]WHH57763.1 metallophosphoesterase family protein [Petroclostridium sp. X23]
MEKKKGLLKSLRAISFVTLIAVIAFAVQAAAADDTSGPDHVVLSWTGDPRTTQTVAWRDGSGVTEAKVQYIEQSKVTDGFAGAAEKAAVCSELYTGYSHFEATLEGLQPGAAYNYRVGTDGSWSETASFTTQASGIERFSFMDMGDIQEGGDTGPWKKLLQEALANDPDIRFSLVNGDQIDNPNDITQWNKFYEAAERVFDRIPMMTALGNHEYANKDMYCKAMALPQNGPDGYKEQFYSFDYANAHFVVLDSNVMGDGEQCKSEIEWLENDLKNSTKKWKFAIFHHPPYCVNSGNSGDDVKAEMMRESWVPVLEENGVDMVFVGHQHMYMRTFPIKAGEVQEKQTDGITYVMVNSSDKYYVNPETHDYIKKVFYGADEGTNNYTVINIDGNVLTMTTRDTDGNVKDMYKINKSKGMDSSVAVTGVKLLDSSFNQIETVSAGGSFRLQAHMDNYTGKPQTVTAVMQVRGGDGAAAVSGGVPLGIVSMRADVAVEGADVYADFALSDTPSGTAYVDVFILDDDNVPVDMPYQKFSFQIN